MNQKLKTILFYAYITAVVLAVGIILFHLSTAEASGCDNDCKTTTNTVVKEDSDEWKYVVGTAIVTCAAISIYRKTWCWEKEDKKPLPNPGPSPRNDVTPDPQPRIIFK